MANKNGHAGRLSRDEWLARAFDILALEGQGKLRIDSICKALGVTKGSFYWHFKDRDDFVRSVVEFWSEAFTDPVVQEISQMGGSARDRLKTLMLIVTERGFARYDVSIRAWAAQDPELVAGIVKTVDKRHLAFTGSLFEEMGFDKENAEMRARACVAYISYEASVLAKSAKRDRPKMLEEFFNLIAQPASALPS
ncbi:MAG: TetR/AcrR family transcriptional regulator [Alphaproteobacteria bacterium]